MTPFRADIHLGLDPVPPVLWICARPSPPLQPLSILSQLTNSCSLTDVRGLPARNHAPSIPPVEEKDQQLPHWEKRLSTCPGRVRDVSTTYILILWEVSGTSGTCP